jgi:hypothetical protein
MEATERPTAASVAAWWKRQPAWKWIVLIVVAFIAYSVLKPGVDLHGAPNVKGLTLPVAEQQLKAHGFSADVHTNALFGVIVSQHYYVCSENSPQGHLVVVDAEKKC